MSSRREADGGAGPAVSLSDVTKVYSGNVVAVNGVSLSVQDREFLTLLGPSGSGKTTILKMIAGFISPTSGQIQIANRDVSRVPSHQRNIGMVFQNYALFPHLTVAENLAFPLEMRRVDRAEMRRRIGQTLEVVRLPGLESRYPRQLSGGQQQRVALARAMIYEPSVLLMDEPLGALDKRLREDLQLEFKRLHQELSVTVLYVTHDQEEALLMSDRIAIFHEGQIEQLGGGEDLYRWPRSPFVGTFMGESNIFRGTLESGRESASILMAGVSLRGTMRPEVSLNVGDSAALMVRPENCRITPVDATRPPSADWLPATVEQVMYLGSSAKVQVACAGTTVSVRMIPGREETRLTPGTPVAVEWNVMDAVLVPDL